MNSATPVSIYQIGSEEVELLIDLAIKTFSETFTATNSLEDIEDYNARCFTAEVLLDEMKNPDSWFYFAEYDGKLAGYLKVNIGDAQTEIREVKGFEVERIYVLEEFHGKGVGPCLMDFAIEKGQTLGKSYLWLGVWEFNYRAQRFYEKYGMEVFDDHVFLMGKTPQRDLLMRMSL